MKLLSLLAVCFLTMQCATIYKLQTNTCEELGNKELLKLFTEKQCYANSNMFEIPSLGEHSIGMNFLCKEGTIAVILIDITESREVADKVTAHPTVVKINECYITPGDKLFKFQAIWFPVASKQAEENNGEGDDNAG